MGLGEEDLVVDELEASARLEDASDVYQEVEPAGFGDSECQITHADEVERVVLERQSVGDTKQQSKAKASETRSQSKKEGYAQVADDPIHVLSDVRIQCLAHRAAQVNEIERRHFSVYRLPRRGSL